MNKKALLDYALFARKELETQIALSLNKLGIYKDKILKANVVGDYTIIEGNPDSYPKRVYGLRKMMVSEYFEGEEKFETVVEEFAYTWFNRLVAIRFMEVHDYFPHGFHVLTSRDGSYEPEILSNLPYVLSELNLEEDVIRSLRDQNKTEELYRYVLVKQCSALSKIIPDIFDVREPYFELLLPNNLLSQDSVIRKIELIPEEDFMNDIEVVGWLYQFYNSVKKDEVFASKETITKDTLPAVTQLFTPDWIVRYMADNSVGRLWLESYPNSSLEQSLKYYVKDAKQDEETQKKLDEIKYKNVNPEEIKIIEPCCGSGHILVYVFDLLLKMYLEQGYSKRDIPALILKNNLYGLDVDKRAAQLAKFSLVMKARSIDNRFFNEDRFVNPRVFEIKDSQLLISLNYKDAMKSLHFSEQSIKLAEYLVGTFEYGKVIGSLLKVASKDYAPLLDDIKRCKEVESPGIFEQDFYDKGLKRLRHLVRVARVMARKYDVMITNPPYIGISSLEAPAKNYANVFYKETKNDMYSMFMEADLVKKNGMKAILNLQNWMSGYSYIDYRKHGIKQNTFLSILHLGSHAFEDFGGEVVQNVAYVAKNTFLDANILFFDLRNGVAGEKELSFLQKNTNGDWIIKKASSFSQMPSNEYAYWASDEVLFQFGNNPFLNQIGEAKSGVMTGKDDVFIRAWYEVNFNDIAFDCNHNNYAGIFENKKWYPVTNGGITRKWYGNLTVVVDMKHNGYDISHYGNNTYRLRDSNYYFKEACSWSTISSNNLAVRITPQNVLFGNNGPTYFTDHLYYIMGFLNSKVSNFMCNMLNPTLSILIDDIEHLPIKITDEEKISDIVSENIKIAKKEWDIHETSWSFAKSPIIKFGSLPEIVDSLMTELKKETAKLKSNEELLNSHYIEIYGLTKELSSEIDTKSLTISVPSEKTLIKELISYLIGCLMGRYSLEREGVVYAGGDTNAVNFEDYVDEDGVLPIYQFVGITDGLTTSICKLVKRIYGDTYYQNNIDYIANVLGRKNDEGAEETINRYLNEDFYNDHLSLYKTKTTGSRPIYWMFNSGKVGAFKCLVYLHRYNKNTLAKINAKYFLPRTALYKAERERLTDQLTRADLAQKKKIESQLRQIEAAEDELQIYGQVLDHMANQFIEIDLDDGVKVNYVKFQGVSIVVNGATVKKDLLVPFGLEKQKK